MDDQPDVSGLVDKTQAPGINFQGVVVDRVRFDDLPPNSPKPDLLNYQIRVDRVVRPDVADISVTIRIVEERRMQTGNAGTPLQVDGEPDGILVEVRVTGRFAPVAPGVSNFPFDRFANQNAVPLLMPFAREAIARVTSSSRNGIMLLPPINVLALLAQSEAEKAVTAPATPGS